MRHHIIIISDDEHETTMIPLLDIRLYRSNPTEFVKELREAFHTVGFLLLRHDVALAPRMLNEARRFFDAPLEQKQTISYENSPPFEVTCS